jgi:nitroreductase
MLLESANQWLGSVRVELIDRWVLRSEFDIPENLFPVCILPMGYKTDECPVSPMHTNKKSIEELVVYK